MYVIFVLLCTIQKAISKDTRTSTLVLYLFLATANQQVLLAVPRGGRASKNYFLGLSATLGRHKGFSFTPVPGMGRKSTTSHWTRHKVEALRKAKVLSLHLEAWRPGSPIGLRARADDDPSKALPPRFPACFPTGLSARPRIWPAHLFSHAPPQRAGPGRLNKPLSEKQSVPHPPARAGAALAAPLCHAARLL